MTSMNAFWLNGFSVTLDSYRRLIEAAVSQLSDEEIRRRPAPDRNSVAVLLRHLGGNLKSRWTDFLETDGEKDWRNRETEFADWPGDRTSLMAHFDEGWQCFSAAIETCQELSVDEIQLKIRGESHTVAEALNRSITHVAYHAGQLTMVAREVHEGPWNWLTIPPGESEYHNQTSWGTSASRRVMGDADSDR